MTVTNWGAIPSGAATPLDKAYVGNYAAMVSWDATVNANTSAELTVSHTWVYADNTNGSIAGSTIGTDPSQNYLVAPRSGLYFISAYVQFENNQDANDAGGGYRLGRIYNNGTWTGMATRLESTGTPTYLYEFTIGGLLVLAASDQISLKVATAWSPVPSPGTTEEATGFLMIGELG